MPVLAEAFLASVDRARDVDLLSRLTLGAVRGRCRSSVESS